MYFQLGCVLTTLHGRMDAIFDNWATWSAMVCCRCSRTGTCGHCACAKSKQNMWQLPPGKAWKLHQHSISEPWHCSHVGYNHHCWCELHWSCYWRFFIFTQNTNLSCPFPLPSRLCEELVTVGLECSSIPSHQMNFLQLPKSCLWTVRTLNYHTTLLNYHTCLPQMHLAQYLWQKTVPNYRWCLLPNYTMET